MSDDGLTDAENLPHDADTASLMSTPDDVKARAMATYNAAADHFDDPANAFWDRFGRRTVDRLALREGARVLDVCCGSGASAIPAAKAVGPVGSVLGVDLSDELLALARTKAKRLELSNVEFRTGDLLASGLPTGQFDAVICVFGIFFVPDVRSAVRELWRLVRPGGQLAITTWGPRLFEPASTYFWNAVREIRPDLYKGFNPWDSLCDPEAVRALISESGGSDCEVVLEPGMHPLATPEEWWTIVLGSGYRGTIEQLSAADRERIRRENLRPLREASVRSVEANVILARATKPLAAKG